MRIELVIVDGKDAGYNLVPEDAGDKELLKRVQDLHFLADSKQDKMQYEGVTLDQNADISRMIFLQRRFAILPDYNKTKQELYKVILQKKVTV